MSPCLTGGINSSDISTISDAVQGHRVKQVLINCCKYVMAADTQRTMLLMAVLFDELFQLLQKPSIILSLFLGVFLQAF